MFKIALVLASTAFSALIALIGFVLGTRQRRVFPEGAPWYLLTNAVFALWSGIYILLLLNHQSHWHPLLSALEMALHHLSALIFFGLILTLREPYARRKRRFILAGLALLSAASLTALWTSPSHVVVRRLDYYAILAMHFHAPWYVLLAAQLLPETIFLIGFYLYYIQYHHELQARSWPLRILALLPGLGFAAAIVHTLWPFPSFAVVQFLPPMLWFVWAGFAYRILRDHFGFLTVLFTHALLKRVREGVLLFDQQDRLIWWNEAATNVLPLTDKDAYRPAHEVLADYPDLLAAYEHRFEPGTVLLLPMPDGGHRYLEVFVPLVQRQPGLPAGRALLFYDLTDWRLMQDRLTFRVQSEQLFHGLFALAVQVQTREALAQRALRLFLRPLGDTYPRQGGIWLATDEDADWELLAWDSAGETTPPAPEAVRALPRNQGPEAAKRALLEHLQKAYAPLVVRMLTLGSAERPLGWVALMFEREPSDDAWTTLRRASEVLSHLVDYLNALRRRSLMQRIYESISEAVIVYDAEGHIIDFNPAAQRFFGLEQLKGRHAFDLFGPLPEDFLTELRQRLDSEGRWSGLQTYQAPDGSTHYLEASVVVVPDVGGVLGIVVYRDVTERERLRIQLERQKDFLERLLVISQAVLKAPLSTRRLLSSLLQALREVTQATSASLLLVDQEGNLQDAFIEDADEAALPEDEAERWAFLQRVLEHGLASRALREHRVVGVPDTAQSDEWLKPEGQTPLWRSALSVPLYYQDQPVGVLSLGFREPYAYTDEHIRLLEAAADMIALALYHARLYEQQFELNQQLLRAKEQAEALRRQQEEFFANLSHEMRTPLQAILGYIEWLSLTQPEFVAENEEFRQIERAAHNLLSTIEQILAYQKAQRSEEIHIETFTPQQIVDEVLAIVQPLAQRNNDRIHLEITRDVVLRTDRNKVLHIVLNLMSNAVKFTEDGDIWLRMQPEERDGELWLRIEVEDTGIGIPPERLEAIFQPFQQADDSISRRFGGTGLGLALVHHYVTMLGGTIEVQSQVGKGSRFIVHIPAHMPARKS
ncbi:MAG: GAF domain-containing protein [Chloroflexi bacterium]|nr:GAF domain-containing protein [Chloroflexota bacterium]